MKRVVSLLLTLAIMLVYMPAMASQTDAAIILNETFNGSVTNSLPGSVSVLGDGSLAQTIVDGNRKILRVRNRWESAIVRFGVTIGSSSALVLEARVKIDDSYSEKALLQYESSANRYTLITRKPSGAAYDMNGKRIGTIPNNKWVKLTAILNLDTLRYELFIDGDLVSHRGQLQNPGEIIYVGFTSDSNEDNETTMYCDYFRVYTGDTILSDEYFPAAAMNDSVKKTSKEHATEPDYKPSLIFELDCESRSVGETINGMPVYTKPAAIAKDYENNNQYFEILYEKGKGALVGAYIKKEAYPCLIIQSDIRVNRGSKVEWLLKARSQASGGVQADILHILPGGKLAAVDGETVITKKIAENKWVNVAVVIDYRSRDFDYYVDGELVLENFEFPDSVKNLSSNLWEVRWAPNSTGISGTHNLDLDNIYFYSGIKPVSVDELLGGGSVMSVTDTIDYELDSSPLNPDMKGFTPVSESISKQKNPSSFLTDYSETKKTYDGAICVVANTPNIWIKNGKYSSDYIFKWDGNHLLGPAGALAAFINKPMNYDSASQTVTIGNVKAHVGDSFISVGDKTFESESTVTLIDGAVYIPLREFVRYGMNKFYGESTKGFAVIAPDEREYTYNLNPGGNQLVYSVNDYSHMMAYLILDRLNAESIQELYNQKVSEKPHPRVLTTPTDVPLWASLAQTDANMKTFSDAALKMADEWLKTELNINYVPAAQLFGMPEVSEPETMYYAWYMTGDRAYVDKVKENAAYLMNLESWNHEAHMLTTSWICLYLAYVYDLFYDELTPSERDAIAQTCIDKAIVHHKTYMYGTQWNDWPTRDFNWNVISNTGPMVAAMVFLGEGYDDALLLDCLEKGQVSLGYFMQYFAPDGGGWESMGYTNYILTYLSRYLEAVNNYFGDDLGFLDYPGLTEIGEFLVNCTGAKVGMALHDDSSQTAQTSALSMWFVKLTGDYELQRRNIDQLFKNRAQLNLNAVNLMKSYMPVSVRPEYTDKLDKIFRGLEVGTARDSWGSGTQSFITVHAGTNNCAHAQYDMGNFFYEANGVVWASDIGREDYAVGGGANVYASRTEGHNLWIVNPDNGAGQNKVAYGQVEMIESKPKGVIYAVDLLPAYYGQVEKAERRYMLSENRKIFTVQDEIVPFEKENEFYWFWHTQADIEIDEENKMVTLSKNDRKLNVYFDSNVDFTISKQEKLEPLVSSPKVDRQLKLSLHNSMKKIVVNFYSEGEDVTFRAVAVPYGQEYEREELVPFERWSIPDGSAEEGYCDAQMIYVNGTPIEGFDPKVYDYTVYHPYHLGIPEITVDTNGSVKEIIPKAAGNPTMVVRIEGNDGCVRNYTITLIDMYREGLPENAAEVKAVGVEASKDDGNVPENAIDGNIETRWSAEYNEWITLDLGEVKTIDTVAMYLHGEVGRNNRHEIWISTDGINFTPVSDTVKTIGTAQWEHLPIGTHKARYVKFTCHGGTNTTWNSIKEIKIFSGNGN